MSLSAISAFAVLCYVFCVNASTPCFGQCEVVQIQKFLAPQPASFDYLGGSLGIDGDYIVAGAIGRDLFTSSGFEYGAGAAYLWQRINGQWSSAPRQFIASNHDQIRGYGRAVAIDGKTIVVAASSNGSVPSSAGALYVYESDGEGGWPEVAKLTASDATEGAALGDPLAVEGEIIVASARYAFVDGACIGAVYVFEKIEGEWMETAKLRDLSVDTCTYFGNFIAIHDGVIACWSRAEDGLTGVINLYEKDERGSWTDAGRLVADVQGTSMFPGLRAVSMQEDMIFCGVVDCFGGPSTPPCEAAAVFRTDESGEWIDVARIFPSGPTFTHGFAGRSESIAVSGRSIVVGAAGDDTRGDSAGAVYLLRRDSSGEVREELKFYSEDIGEGDHFGLVQMDGETLVVGAHKHSHGAFQSGAVYVFDILCPCPWDCADPPSHTVDIDDLLAVLDAMTSGEIDCDIAPRNEDGTFGDKTVDVDDLLAVIRNFGECP